MIAFAYLLLNDPNAEKQSVFSSTLNRTYDEYPTKKKFIQDKVI